MAYPTFIAASAIVAVPGYSSPAQTVQWPAGIQDGDLVVLIGVIENGVYTPTVNGGFTLLQRHGANQFQCEIYSARKIYRTGDAAPTVHPGQTYNSRWRNVAFRGADQTTSVEASRSAKATEPDNTINIPASTSTIGEVLQVVIAAQLELQATTLTPNPSLNQVVTSDGSAFGFVVATALGPTSAGTVSAKTITTSRANNHGYIDFLIRPANVSPPQSPQGTTTIGTISDVTASGVTIAYSYTLNDQTGFEYSLNGTDTPVTVQGGTSPLTLSGLTANTTYTVQIRAVNATAAGTWSTAVQFTTSAAPQVPQGTFTVGSISVGQTTASVPYMYSAGDATSIQYRLGGTGTPQTTSASPLALSGLNAGSQYSIQFRAVNASGPQLNWSTAVSFTTSSAPGPIASFTTGALTDLNGVLQANKNLLYLAAYNKTTGQLVVRKTTGLTTDTNGRCTISDAALTQGQEYRWDWETAEGHRCMPLGTAQ